MKTCTKCKQEKHLHEFYKDNNTKDRKTYRCKECIKFGMNKYYGENPDKVKEINKKWRKNNPDKVKVSKWRIKYPEKRAEYKRKYEKKRRIKDIEYKLLTNCRTRISKFIKRKNRNATKKLISCTIKHLRRHLEKQFDEEMTWDNYGTYWHIDHILPCSKFDLTDEKQRAVCFHYSNLQPLKTSKNLIKGDKIVGFENLKINRNFILNANKTKR